MFKTFTDTHVKPNLIIKILLLVELSTYQDKSSGPSPEQNIYSSADQVFKYIFKYLIGYDEAKSLNT